MGKALRGTGKSQIDRAPTAPIDPAATEVWRNIPVTVPPQYTQADPFFPQGQCHLGDVNRLLMLPWGDAVGASIEASESNNAAPIDVDLYDDGDTGLATGHETVMLAFKPLKLKLKAGATSLTKQAKGAVINPAAFATAGSKSPARCVALITATGPGGETSAANDTARLIIDVFDKNDF